MTSRPGRRHPRLVYVTGRGSGSRHQPLSQAQTPIHREAAPYREELNPHTAAHLAKDHAHAGQRPAGPGDHTGPHHAPIAQQRSRGH